MIPLSDDAVRRLREAGSWPEFNDSRYAALEVIGRGGMGTVYQARDELLDREVAIKVSNGLAHASLETRLRAEARILARIEHPGIVPIHDVGHLADGRIFYVMKRVQGKTLLDHLGQHADRGERLRVFERICEPVAFAHSHGVVHRDLKPENVMVGPFGEVLVLDWGVAKVLAAEAPTEAGTDAGADALDGCTTPGTVIGTRGFMSPEQARGAVDAVDHRADVYGLGAILVTILVGSPPPVDSAAAAAETMARHAGVPRPLRAICARALAANPADRYQTALAMSADVARFCAGEHVLAYDETWIERAARLCRRYQAAILLVLAYLAMRVLVGFLIRR